jgi:hypothetical protein
MSGTRSQTPFPTIATTISPFITTASRFLSRMLERRLRTLPSRSSEDIASNQMQIFADGFKTFSKYFSAAFEFPAYHGLRVAPPGDAF